MFSTSNAVQYRFRDTSSDPSSGAIRSFNGRTTGQQGAWITTTSLEEIYVQAPQGASTDTVEMQVSNGSQWSAVASQTITSHAASSTTPLSSVSVVRDFGSMDTMGWTYWLNEQVDSASNPHDWFKFNVNDPSGANVCFYLNGSVLGQVSVYKSTGERVFETNSIWPNYYQAASTDLAAGSYYMSVDAPANSTMNYYFQIFRTDRTPDLSVNNPDSATVAANSKTYLKDVFSATDRDGRGIQQWYVADTNYAAGSGFLVKNGVALAQGFNGYVSAADFATMYYQASSGDGSDSIQVRAFNGQVESWQGEQAFVSSAAWVDQTGLGSTTTASASLVDPTKSTLQSGLLAA